MDQLHCDQRLEDNSAGSEEIEWSLDIPVKQHGEPHVDGDANPEADFHGFDDDDNNWLRGLWDDDDGQDHFEDAVSDNEEPNTPAPVRRSDRANAGVPPARYPEGANAVKENLAEPRTYKEAVSGPQCAE